MKRVIYLVVLSLWGEYLIALYGISDDIMELAYSRTMIFCIAAPAMGFVNTMSAYYQAINREKAANIINIGRCAILATLAIILSPLIGAAGIFYAQSGADLCAILIVLALIPRREKAKV